MTMKNKDKFIADVRAAYLTKKLMPIQHVFNLKLNNDGIIVAHRGQCCAFGALVVGQMGVTDEVGEGCWSDAVDAIAASYGIDLEDFTSGFDFGVPRTNVDDSFTLGAATWEAVKDLSSTSD